MQLWAHATFPRISFLLAQFWSMMYPVQSAAIPDTVARANTAIILFMV
jgi:hypothetical protein